MHVNSELVKKVLDTVNIVEFTRQDACNEVNHKCDKCEWYVHGKEYCELDVAHNALCNIVYDNVPHGKNVEES